MYKYDIQGFTLRWFEDYLYNRKQYVTYNSYKSNYELIMFGVPQGSILGPLLVLLYINDLSSVPEACFSILFADDTNIFITGRNVNEMCNQLNADLFRVQEWLHCNKLSLNVPKTHYMIFTPRNKVVDDISYHHWQYKNFPGLRYLIFGCPNWFSVKLENAYQLYL